MANYVKINLSPNNALLVPAIVAMVAAHQIDCDVRWDANNFSHIIVRRHHAATLQRIAKCFEDTEIRDSQEPEKQRQLG